MGFNVLPVIATLVHRAVFTILLIIALSVYSSLVSATMSPNAVESGCQKDHCIAMYNRIQEKPSVGPARCSDQLNYAGCLKQLYESNRQSCDNDIGFRTMLINSQSQVTKSCIDLLDKDDIFRPIPSTTVPSDSVCSDHIDSDKHKRFCSIFGASHVWTFGDRMQTCKNGLGAQPLFSSSKLTIQVTLDGVGQFLGSSQISAITVLIKKHKCVPKPKTYYANIDFLPSAFKDGSNEIDNSTVIHSEKNHITLKIRHLNTTIELHRYEPWLSVSLAVGSEAGDDYSGSLCSSGCIEHFAQFPSSTVNRLLRKDNNIKTSKAYSYCSSLTDFLLESCIYDYVIRTPHKRSHDSALHINTAVQDDVISLHHTKGVFDIETLIEDQQKSTSSALRCHLCHSWLLAFLSFLFSLMCSI